MMRRRRPRTHRLGESATLHHVTLSTGHVRASPRSEVPDDVIAFLSPFLPSLAAGEEVELPEHVPPAALLTGAVGGDCLIATVWAEADGAPLATIGCARGAEAAADLWRMLHDSAVGILPVTVATEPPRPPWCAARLGVGLPVHVEAARWLGDFERCLAWAWIENGKPSREALRRPPTLARAPRSRRRPKPPTP